MTTLRRQVTDRWVDHPVIDYALTLLVVIAVAWVDPDGLISDAERPTWHQTLAEVSGILLGFAGVAVTLVFTVTPTDRLKRVYDALGNRLERLVMSSLGAMVVATVGFAGVPLLDSGSSEIRLPAIAALSTFSALRCARLWWLFRRIIQALMRQTGSQDAVGAAEERPWVRPMVGEEDYTIPTRRVRRKR